MAPIRRLLGGCAAQEGLGMKARLRGHVTELNADGTRAPGEAAAFAAGRAGRAPYVIHARVSVDFPREFGCYLGAPLRRPNASR